MQSIFSVFVSSKISFQLSYSHNVPTLHVFNSHLHLYLDESSFLSGEKMLDVASSANNNSQSLHFSSTNALIQLIRNHSHQLREKTTFRSANYPSKSRLLVRAFETDHFSQISLDSSTVLFFKRIKELPRKYHRVEWIIHIRRGNRICLLLLQL